MTSFVATLEELELTEAGPSFVYEALNALSVHYHLSDVVLTVVDDSLGLQMFRLDGKSVSADIAVQLGSAPGLYCVPNAVPALVLDAVQAACQRALSRRVVQFNGVDAEPDQGRAVENTYRVVDRGYSEGMAREVSISFSRFRDVCLDTFHYLRMQHPRALISGMLLTVNAVALIMTVGNLHGPLRFLLGLVVGLVVPGWSLVGLLGLQDAALEVGLTLAVSLASLMVAAQLLMTLHVWHPVVLEEFTCLVCVPSLLRQSRGLWRVQR